MQPPVLSACWFRVTFLKRLSGVSVCPCTLVTRRGGGGTGSGRGMTSVTWVALLSKPAENIEHGPRAWSTLPRPRSVCCAGLPANTFLMFAYPTGHSQGVSVLRGAQVAEKQAFGWFGHPGSFEPGARELVGWGQWSECVATKRPRCSGPSGTPSAC